MNTRKPTPADLQAAYGKRLHDVIAPRLKILFVGINPGLYSAAIGCHFARPGNRFWPALHRAGLTPRRLAPAEQYDLLRYGYGVSNIVNRATVSADELTPKELAAAFGKARATIGAQAETLSGAAVWVLPNPSGRTAGYQLADLARLFRKVLRVSLHSNG